MPVIDRHIFKRTMRDVISVYFTFGYSKQNPNSGWKQKEIYYTHNKNSQGIGLPEVKVKIKGIFQS